MASYRIHVETRHEVQQSWADYLDTWKGESGKTMGLFSDNLADPGDLEDTERRTHL